MHLSLSLLPVFSFFSDFIHSVNVGQPRMVYAGLPLSASHGYRRFCVARMARSACLAILELDVLHREQGMVRASPW
jgi:hypothetical protein